MYIYYNPNPKNKSTSDCVIRMLTKIYGYTWTEAYLRLSVIVLEEFEMPSDNDIWGIYLLRHGFKKKILPSYCPDCMTISEFADMYNHGTYVVCTNTHTVAVIDGNYYDAADSGNEVITYYFERR